MKIIQYLIILSLFTISCNNNEDEPINISADYKFIFLNKNEDINFLLIEVFDNQNYSLLYKPFYDIQQNKMIEYSFPAGSKIKITINTTGQFQATYKIIKNNIVIHGNNELLNGNQSLIFIKSL